MVRASKAGTTGKAAGKSTSTKAGSPVAKKSATKAAPVKSSEPVEAPSKADTPKAVPTRRSATAREAPPADGGAKAVPAGKVAPAKQAERVKASPADKVPPMKPSAANDKFVEEQRRTLAQERENYIRQASLLRAEAEQLAADREPGDVQFDEESGEGDSMNVERERDLVLSAQAMSAVDEIDRALEKMKIGTYGVCERCHEAIPKERLRALPYAALCVRCKSGGIGRSRG
ncbi:MAG: TraR/DksA C4-type zinc finger protein [Actinobacteria bacterium]|nr:TraR/DksA C4-type zinc finger protein [Actinomycetota bacterium]